jgi:DNA-binding transcriptional LysR family regulator
MIDLVALDALRAVDAHGSVVSAAEALGFTPSAVSPGCRCSSGSAAG